MKRLLYITLIALFATSAHAVQLQDLVRLKGSEGSKLIGVGLVVGLSGTGDGKFFSTTRSVAQLIQEFNDPNAVAAEIKNSKNVALVTLTATLPEAGIREGDRVDVHLSSIGGAKSLEGGRLFLAPMTGPRRGMDTFAFAEGSVVMERASAPTVGVIPDGAQLTKDIFVNCVQDGMITLVLNSDVATWPMANNIASLINGRLSPDGPEVARAQDGKNVLVRLSPADQGNPATFISTILTSWIDPALVVTGARVVINERTGTIVMSSDVEISPLVISHGGLTITTVTPPALPDPELPSDPALLNAPKRFIGIDPGRRGGAKLSDLVAAFNQLDVPAKDRIAIINSIRKTGKLHATVVVQ